MRILHLYYDLLNLYGEYANVLVLKKHLEDQGFEVEVDKLTVKDKINFNAYDFIYCGSGLESNLKLALLDLRKREKSFKEALNSGTYMLFTGNAMELLGENIDEEEGLGVVPISSNTTSSRYTGDIVVENKNFGEVVGFINKSTLIVENSKDMLFKYIFKDKSLKDANEGEGYRYKNLFGTHIIGPILSKNPKLIKYFVKQLARTKDRSFVYKEFDYKYEKQVYKVTLEALKKRI